ncbi:hypothetical protein GCM10010412_010560 [Nonomuraea recticatena]|uniref:Uncharacterized protein n=1 Tax=Nonomuraea recticatena TaxID=46178 RepID=A0ABP6DNT4_9ACTN
MPRAEGAVRAEALAATAVVERQTSASAPDIINRAKFMGKTLGTVVSGDIAVGRPLVGSACPTLTGSWCPPWYRLLVNSQPIRPEYGDAVLDTILR